METETEITVNDLWVAGNGRLTSGYEGNSLHYLFSDGADFIYRCQPYPYFVYGNTQGEQHKKPRQNGKNAGCSSKGMVQKAHSFLKSLPQEGIHMNQIDRQCRGRTIVDGRTLEVQFAEVQEQKSTDFRDHL
ncbi:MAG: hypothetical protein IJ196_07400 [Prevotella sp.]|nr:hypothetical protein [Prevotella sp.]